MPWNPDKYHQFQSERAAPFDDLVALLDNRPGQRVVDLGCGPGELTLRLAELLPDSDVLGVDSSPEMLKRAEQYARPGLRFELADIANVVGKWDLLFSHAAIQWIDDHEWLIPRLVSMIAPGGQIAVQLPSNGEHPALASIRRVALEAPFKQALDGYNRKFPELGVGRYAEILWECGGHDITAIEKVYPHVLDDADALADWSLGTALVPYFDRLPNDLHEPFLDRYKTILRALWPGSPVFYGFRRILFVATF